MSRDAIFVLFIDGPIPDPENLNDCITELRYGAVHKLRSQAFVEDQNASFATRRLPVLCRTFYIVDCPLWTSHWVVGWELFLMWWIYLSRHDLNAFIGCSLALDTTFLKIIVLLLPLFLTVENNLYRKLIESLQYFSFLPESSQQSNYASAGISAEYFSAEYFPNQLMVN